MGSLKLLTSLKREFNQWQQKLIRCVRCDNVESLMLIKSYHMLKKTNNFNYDHNLKSIVTLINMFKCTLLCK